MDEIRPIETLYKGYRFRSRLEARWAVFFDALGLSWEYEPEGYLLSNGQRYLPDFFVKDCGLFVEVKGGYPNEEERERCMWLADGTQRAVLLVHGLPLENFAHLWCWDLTDSSAGRWNGSVVFIFPAGCPAKAISRTDSRLGDRRYLFLWGDFQGPIDGEYRDGKLGAHPQAWAADKARAARFEFGEKGARS